jgi:O-antigen ligase
LLFRLDSFTDTGCASRAGPVGDGLLKYAYWCIAVFAFVVVATQTYESPRRVGRVWCAAAMASAIYGWLLVIPSALNLPAPLLPGMDEAARITLGGREILRGGTFQEGNFFALYLLVSIAIAVWMRRNRLAVFLAATVIITFSTANVAGLVAMAALAVLARVRRTRDIRVQARMMLGAVLALLLLVVGLVASGYLQTIFVAKLSGEQFASGLDRLDLTVAGARMFAAHPLVGVGLSQYGFNYRPFQLTDVFDVARPVKPIATNSWIELAAETGLLGMALIVFFGAIVWRTTAGADRIALRCGLLAIALGLFTFPAPTVTFLWGFLGFVVGVHLHESAIGRSARMA